MASKTKETTSISKKIAQYESFLNDKLKPDLKKTLDLRDAVYDQITEYLKLKTQIRVITENQLTELKTMVDLGTNFYVQAKVPDTMYIFVNVGFGFHVQLTLVEAIEFIDRKEKVLQRKAEQYTKKASNIKANIKLVLEALTEIMKLEKDPQLELRDDLFL
ncbi:2891_t:CDS:2 [Ambispora gerdemannii]|uniref:2891_t:CDS:1 n=1 Tax=Ambispora gerdemannii TaxID=144530 RepID=A0A9N8YXT3_9GLOM|nr:2891_t:CDS:2 [Ambispora gerdemannii]